MTNRLILKRKIHGSSFFWDLVFTKKIHESHVFLEFSDKLSHTDGVGFQEGTDGRLNNAGKELILRECWAPLREC